MMKCPKCEGTNLKSSGSNRGKPRVKCSACGYKTINPIIDRNILIIGDIHEPFSLGGYLEFNKMLYEKYNITDVVLTTWMTNYD